MFYIKQAEHPDVDEAAMIISRDSGIKNGKEKMIMKRKSKSILKSIMTFVLTVAMAMGAVPLPQFTMVVQADMQTVNVDAVSAFGSPDSNGVYTLENRKYILGSDITMSTATGAWSYLTLKEGEAEIDLNGYTLNLNGQKDGYHNSYRIWVKGGTLTISDSRSNGKITGGTYENGAIYIEGDGAAVIMNGGEISGNEGYSCGGVKIHTGTFTMNSGKICNNTIRGNLAGGVMVGSNGTFNMNGGEISGNTGGNSGSKPTGGVLVDGGTFNVSGNPVITGNKLQSNVVNNVSGTINVTGNLTEGANICVNAGLGATVAQGSNSHTITDNEARYFHSDTVTDVPIAVDDNKVKFAYKLTSDMIEDIAEQTYTGSTITPELTVKNSGATLILDTDYTVECSNNTNASGATNDNAPTVTVTGKDNYCGTATKKFSIAQKEVGLTWGETSFTYDGQSHVPTATATGLCGDDNCTVTVTGGQTDYSATAYTATASSLSNENYKLPSEATTTFTIGRRAVTVTAKEQSVEVNGSIDSSLSKAELSGAVEGHTLTAVTLTAENVTAVGSSTVTPSNATIMNSDTDVTSNYEITYTAGTLTVTKTQPKIKTNTTFTAGSLTYGQALSSSTIIGTMVDKSNEETEVAGTFAWKNPTTVPQVSDSNTTEYDVIFTPTSANYGAVELKAQVTVNPKELTVKADDKTRIAGADTNPELTYTVTGLVGTDTKETILGGELACAADSNSSAGQTYDITQGTLAVTNSNYTIGTFTKGTMTVSLPEIKVDTIQPGELTSTTAKLNGSISPAAYATSANVSSVGFKYRKAGVSTWESMTETVGSTFSAEITGLTADSDYEYYAVMTVNGETTEKTGKTITFHTEKEVKTDTGKITVKVKKNNVITENPNVVVSVERGNDVIASKALDGVTTTESTVDFESLPDGNYNVVAGTKDGDFTETKMLSITNGEAVTAEFTVLKGKIAAVVEVEGTDTPKVAVDGLNDILSDDDKKDAAEGKKDVEVKLDVEKKTEAGTEGASEIKSLLTSKEEIGMYLGTVKK